MRGHRFDKGEVAVPGRCDEVRVARVSVVDTTRELWPFYLAALTVVALFAYVPALTLG